MLRSFPRLLRLSTALIPATVLAAAPASTNPLDGQVVGGSATISTPDPATLLIQQQTNSAIINWKSFNIDPGELTEFQLPDSNGVTLNRVLGSQDPSRIQGTLKSNGTVMLVNPDGILFGKGSVVDVGGLLATTADIDDDAFMAGSRTFNKAGKPTSSIVNEGTITVKDAGVAALVAPGVRNDGVIAARLGQVTLGAANIFTLDFYGDDLISLALDDELIGDVYDVKTGKPLADRVKNTGTIKANGGTVALKAATARKVVNSVINNEDVIEANSVGVKNGKIILSAGTATTKKAGTPLQKVKVSGTLNTKGTKKGEKGGKIYITGETIEARAAKIDASGMSGGGMVAIGGDYLGGNATEEQLRRLGISREAFALSTSTSVSLDELTSINASAIGEGSGGKVVVWADDHTSSQASISSKGGATGGNGGFVEVSGHNTLDFGSTIDLFATYGQNGTLLLDPLNVIIGGTGTSGISAASIQNALATSNVIVTTGPTGTEDGDIAVAENVTWASTNSLSLNAYRNITLNDGVTISNTGSGDLNLRADSTGIGVGLITFSGTGKVDYSGSTGKVSIFYDPVGASKYQNALNYLPFVLTNGTAIDQLTSYMLVNDVNDLQAVATNLGGNYALGQDIDASATASWNSGAGFQPIGSIPAVGWAGFSGLFDGFGHDIGGLAINSVPSATGAPFGLFAAVAGTVRNFSMSNASINVSSTNDDDLSAGILAGYNEGLVENVRVSGEITSGVLLNGLGAFFGGVVGANSNDGSIINSSANVNISYNSLNATPDYIQVYMGGLVGINTNTIENSFATGNLTGGTFIGGLVGGSVDLDSHILNSYARANVIGNTVNSDPSKYSGGLVGYLVGSIENSYSTGQVSGTSSVGGLAAYKYVTATSANSYWDTITSGQNASVSGTGLTTAQLKSVLPSGFSSSIWGLDVAINDGYPYLLWQASTSPSTATTFSPPFPAAPPPPPPPPPSPIDPVISPHDLAPSFPLVVGNPTTIEALRNGLTNSPLPTSSLPDLGTPGLNAVAKELIAAYGGITPDFLRVAKNAVYAQLANLAYANGTSSIPNWNVVGNTNTSDGIGVAATIFQNPETGEFVLAFRGTANKNDWTNANSLLADPTNDLDQIARFANSLAFAQSFALKCGCRFSVVGHSLGGAIAQYVGAELGLKTVAFDPAPLSVVASESDAVRIARANITNFRGPGDPLTRYLGGFVLGPEPILVANAPALSTNLAIVDYTVSNAIYNHSMENLAQAAAIVQLVDRKLQMAAQ